MIVSASYRTDIPTFYSRWFQRRFLAGYCMVRNPYSGKPYRVSLQPADVDGMVFWTRNVRPFLNNLHMVREAGIPFVVTCTMNNYPQALETGIVPTEQAVEDIQGLAHTYGADVPVWRYDPVILTSLTPPAFHIENFDRLAEALNGAVNEVIVSVAQIYRKSRVNLDAAARAERFTWEDPEDAVKHDLVGRLAAKARQRGLRFSVCAQRHLLQDGMVDARCVDAGRLSRIAGKPIAAARKPHRETCGCMESRDIGDYDTCPHGCVYCYAVRNRALALRRFKRHDPDGEFLFS